MIEARGAGLAYDDHGKTVQACRSVDLKVDAGEFLGILGPSGSGKSSLLYLLSGLKSPTSGSIIVDGTDLARLGSEEKAALRLDSFGFVFQYPYLIGYLSAIENVLTARSVPNGKERATALLGSLGLQDKLHRRPHELSGGERQRVCIARALFARPKVIFADEPTANLDHVNGESVVQTLVQHRGAGALVMVTHDPTMLASANRTVKIVDGCIEPDE